MRINWNVYPQRLSTPFVLNSYLNIDINNLFKVPTTLRCKYKHIINAIRVLVKTSY